MSDITNDFGKLYIPQKAFVLYKQEDGNNVYVESYDMDGHGYPVNAHPLNVREATALAKALATTDSTHNFLKPQSLMPRNILHIHPDSTGYALWHTPRQTVRLLFSEGLGIPSGKANIPAMIWKASRDYLHVYAIKEADPITEHTPLYTAPFFNIYQNGKVCMGTVHIKIDSQCGLEKFMEQWQQYFFDSYFSHLITSRSPVKGNVVQLWQSLVKTGKDFPEDKLIPASITLKNLLQ